MEILVNTSEGFIEVKLISCSIKVSGAAYDSIMEQIKCAAMSEYKKLNNEQIKVGSRVKIAETSEFFKEEIYENPHCEGIVDDIEMPGLYQIGVKWDNGAHNSYSETDLIVLLNSDKNDETSVATAAQ